MCSNNLYWHVIRYTAELYIEAELRGGKTDVENNIARLKQG